MPGVNGTNLYNHHAAMRHSLALQNQDAAAQQAQANNYYTSGPPTYNVYPQKQSIGGPQMMPESDLNLAAYGQQQSPVSPGFNQQIHQTMPNSNAVPQGPQPGTNMPNTWNGALFDPSDPALFNFDIASMNFGNHYGALEFGMLGHMATGAGENPPSDGRAQRGSIGQTNGSSQYTPSVFNESPSSQQPFVYNDLPMSDWSNGNQGTYGQTFNRQSDVPNGFIIDNTPVSFTSPESISSPQGHMNPNFEDSPTMTTSGFKQTPPTASTTPIQSHPSLQKTTPQGQPHTLPFQPPRQAQFPIATPKPSPKHRVQQTHGSRFSDPSEIYTSISAPYSYTAGFHSLISYIQRRFSTSSTNTLRIAKALASIRPSFIATTKTLNRDDLIFMEKCFQRTLWEYHGFIEGCGTPTIIARRTGEIVDVGKEFCLLSGWTREVLLGREPNLNVNRGGDSTAGNSANTTGRAGYNTPRMPPSDEGLNSGERTPSRPQPVFLAELLDDESVVNFYEDFARLAFGDSRGSARGHSTLLKYRTKDQFPLQPTSEAESGDHASTAGRGNGVPSHKHAYRQHAGGAPRRVENLGVTDGKVECAYCWSVKRDVFDIPMLIVMNVSLISSRPRLALRIAD